MLIYILRKNEGSSDDFEKKAESDNEIDNDTQIVKSEGEEAADPVIPDIEESEDESAKDTESHVWSTNFMNSF